MSIRCNPRRRGGASWSAIATPIRYAAPRISPRHRRERSVAAWFQRIFSRVVKRSELESHSRGEVGRASRFTHPADEASLVEQARGIIHNRALDLQHLQLGHHAAIGGKAARLVAGREHAVARHHDRTWIAPKRLADVARQFDAAELFGDIAIGQRLARRDRARDVVDAAVELRNVRRDRARRPLGHSACPRAVRPCRRSPPAPRWWARASAISP